MFWWFSCSHTTYFLNKDFNLHPLLVFTIVSLNLATSFVTNDLHEFCIFCIIFKKKKKKIRFEFGTVKNDKTCFASDQFDRNFFSLFHSLHCILGFFNQPTFLELVQVRTRDNLWGLLQPLYQ